MKNMLKIFIGSILIPLLGITALAQSPSTMMYQGRLTEAAGNPATGTVEDVVFTIYDAITAGTALWTETLTLDCGDQGIFTAELGLVTPLDNSVFDGSKRWLGIKVGEDAEMTPRQLLTSAPYSIASTAPGVVYEEKPPSNVFSNLFDGATSIDTVSISTPGSGYVYVSAQVSIRVNHTNGTNSAVYFLVSSTPNTLHTFAEYGVGLIQIPDNAPTGSYYYPASVHKVFPVNDAGNYNYYFTAHVQSGYDANDDYFDLQMTAIYFPTAYGTVTAKSSGTLKSGPENSIPGGNTAGEQH